jgi:ribosomal protein S5
MNIELEALRKAIDEAARNLAEVEKGRTVPAESEAVINVLRAQLGAMKATHAALVELDARLLGYPETVP